MKPYSSLLIIVYSLYSVNSDGLTPLDVAFLSNNRELVRLLLSYGAMEGKRFEK